VIYYFEFALVELQGRRRRRRSICIDENDCKVCLCIYFIKNEEEENQLKTRTHTHIQYPHTYYKDDTHYGQIYWIEESKRERRPVATETAGGANRDRQRDRER